MNRYVLKGSMRTKADLSAMIHVEIYTPCPSLPNFCPSCDFSDKRKLWFRRGAKMFCNKCGYALQENDYWHDQITDETEVEFSEIILCDLPD